MNNAFLGILPKVWAALFLVGNVFGSSRVKIFSGVDGSCALTVSANSNNGNRRFSFIGSPLGILNSVGRALGLPHMHQVKRSLNPSTGEGFRVRCLPLQGGIPSRKALAGLVEDDHDHRKAQQQRRDDL